MCKTSSRQQCQIRELKITFKIFKDHPKTKPWQTGRRHSDIVSLDPNSDNNDHVFPRVLQRCANSVLLGIKFQDCQTTAFSNIPKPQIRSAWQRLHHDIWLHCHVTKFQVRWFCQYAASTKGLQHDNVGTLLNEDAQRLMENTFGIFTGSRRPRDKVNDMPWLHSIHNCCPSNCMPAVIRMHTLFLVLPLVYLIISSWQSQMHCPNSLLYQNHIMIYRISMHGSILNPTEKRLDSSCFDGLLLFFKECSATPSNSLGLAQSHLSMLNWMESCSLAAKLHAQRREAQSRQMYQCLSVRIFKQFQWQKENEWIKLMNFENKE